MKSIFVEFGINLRNFRIQNNLTQEELAFRCGLNRTTINEYENGSGNPSLINIATIANELGVHPSELLITD